MLFSTQRAQLLIGIIITKHKWGRGVHGLDFIFFWTRTPVAYNRIRSEVFFVAGAGLHLDFVFAEKRYCLLDFYLTGVKQKSGWVGLVGTGSGADSDSKFAKPDRIRTKKIRVRTPLKWGWKINKINFFSPKMTGNVKVIDRQRQICYRNIRHQKLLSKHQEWRYW